MRGFAFIVGLTTFVGHGNLTALDKPTMTSPEDGGVLKGYVVNVDERNGTFGFRETNGRQCSQPTPLPVLMVIADMYVYSQQMTWDDLRKISNSARITALAVDPSDPSRKVLMISE